MKDICYDLEKLFFNNGIDALDFLDKMKDYFQLYSLRDKIRDLEDFALFSAPTSENISIANVLGYEKFHMDNGTNIIDNFPTFFDSFGDGYHSRSVGMLEYKSDEVVSKLSESFKKEPISVNEFEGNYFISSNGLHRFTVLKLAYLIELYKSKNNIDEDFNIPVKSEKVDLIKTISNYIGNIIYGYNFDMRNQYDENYNKTGKVIVTLNSKNIEMDDTELISFIKDTVEKLEDKEIYSELISKLSKNFDIVKDYVYEHLPYILEDIEIKKNQRRSL